MMSRVLVWISREQMLVILSPEEDLTLIQFVAKLCLK